MRRSPKPVSKGDIFRKADATRWLWVILEVRNPAGHLSHARLRRRDYPVDVRLFSVAALRDKRVFVPVDVSESQTSRLRRSPVTLSGVANTDSLQKVS